MGVDVICVRTIAFEQLEGEGRFGPVSAQIVRELVETMPRVRRAGFVYLKDFPSEHSRLQGTHNRFAIGLTFESVGSGSGR